MKIRSSVLGAIIVAGLLTSGCSSPSEPPKPASVPSAVEPTRTPELVRVPSLEDAIRSSNTTATYDEDAQALADQLRASIERYYAQRGLKAVVEYQSIVLPDSQEPAAGAMVPSGTVVNILIGFGD